LVVIFDQENRDNWIFFQFLKKERRMDNKELKKLLAGMSLVALLGSSGLAVSGCAATSGGSAASSQKDEAIEALRDESGDGSVSA
jgi:hypothetical protein